MRSSLSVCWAVFVWIGLGACTPREEGADDNSGEGGGGQSEVHNARGGNGGQAKGGGGSTDKPSQSGGSSGEAGNEPAGGTGGKSAGTAGNGPGGNKNGTDAGKADAALGSGGKKTSDASAGTGGFRDPDGGAGNNAGGGGKGTPIPTPCSFPASWKAGSATYTTYSFSQGTSSTNGKYQTACGYQGVNSGGDTVTNIASAKNFAAIPGKSSSDFDTKDRCGACVQIGNAIITIIDECPYDTGNQPCKSNPTGHLDLSNAGASTAGVQGDPNKRGQAAWNFVPCPVEGNIVVRLKQGNDNEIYIENTILPISSATCGNQVGSRTNYGAWHFDNYLDQCTMTLTDIAGRTVEVKASDVQDKNVDTGVQFPKCTN